MDADADVARALEVQRDDNLRDDRRARLWCIQDSRWTTEACFTTDDDEVDHDTMWIVACRTCENSPVQCAACKEAS